MNRPQEIHEWHIRVEGRVQGVGFRAAVQKWARTQNILGYVRNCPDGAVEICAQASDRDLKIFVDALRSNPGRGAIDRIQIETAIPKMVYSLFVIQ